MKLPSFDAHGVILDRPGDLDMRFPIVSGITDALPRDESERRMQIYQELVPRFEYRQRRFVESAQ